METGIKKLGTVNGAFQAGVYKKNKLIAFCIDTPNSVAYAFNKTDADTIKGYFNPVIKRRDVNANRIKNGGWFRNDKDANFKRV